MPLDPGLVKRKIVLIERDLRELRKIGVVPLAKYLKDSQFEVLAERYLERIIGRMIDINYHLLSAEKGIMPVDYYHSFLEMGRAGYLPVGLAGSLAHSAGLRNRLAHEYDEIDERQIYKAVGRALKEVPKYLEAILKILDKKAKQDKLI